MLLSSLQLTMAYAYWKSGKTNDIATFDLYFRCVVSIMNIIPIPNVIHNVIMNVILNVIL